MTTSGFESFLNKLENTDSIKAGVDKAVADSLTRMYNRASKRPYTPIDKGELKNSRTKTRVSNGSGEFGYNKVYARRIEYGGRDKKGRYIAPRRYLQSNVNLEKTQFPNDLRKALES
jgi:hypothetical protein